MEGLTRSAGNPVIIAPDGGLVRELLQVVLDSPGSFSIAKVTLEPGVTAIPHHHLKTAEFYCIMSGEAVCYLGGHSASVARGDIVQISQGVRHHLENRGSEPLRYFAISFPRFDSDDVIY